MIKLLVGILLIGSLCILFIPKHQFFYIRFFGTATSFLTFFVSLFLWVLFDDSTPKLQFVDEIVWLSQSNINFTLGIDGISLFFFTANYPINSDMPLSKLV
jgi:NADH-quinone oxidoreductase subunit M